MDGTLNVSLSLCVPDDTTLEDKRLGTDIWEAEFDGLATLTGRLFCYSL